MEMDGCARWWWWMSFIICTTTRINGLCAQPPGLPGDARSPVVGTSISGCYLFAPHCPREREWAEITMLTILLAQHSAFVRAFDTPICYPPPLSSLCPSALGSPNLHHRSLIYGPHWLRARRHANYRSDGLIKSLDLCATQNEERPSGGNVD